MPQAIGILFFFFNIPGTLLHVLHFSHGIKMVPMLIFDLNFCATFTNIGGALLGDIHAAVSSPNWATALRM